MPGDAGVAQPEQAAGENQTPGMMPVLQRSESDQAAEQDGRKLTTLDDKNMRKAPGRSCVNMPDPTDAATKSRPVIVADASPRTV